MAKIGGTQVNLGLGIEATAGTAVSPTIYPQWSDVSLQSIAEKSMFTSARGVRNMSSNSMIRRKYAQGSIGVIPNVEIAPYLFGMALGTVSSAVAGGESAVYEHTITVDNDHASMKTASLYVERGGAVTEEYTNVVLNTLNLEVSDDYASMTADFISQFPATDTLSESFTEETEFAYHNMTAKFGTNITGAEAENPTPLKSLTLNVNNNVLLDEAFLSGSNEITSGCLVAGRLQITGSYSLHFEDTTELAKYQANTKNALVVSFTGASIGNAETEEIRIDLAKLVLTSPPMETNIDGLIVLNQEFEVEYGATDTDMKVIVTNEQDGTDY